MPIWWENQLTKSRKSYRHFSQLCDLLMPKEEENTSTQQCLWNSSTLKSSGSTWVKWRTKSTVWSALVWSSFAKLSEGASSIFSKRPASTQFLLQKEFLSFPSKNILKEGEKSLLQSLGFDSIYILILSTFSI